MDRDIQSQIERARDLLNQLKASCNDDLRRKEVSENTKNLAQEVLLKMRHVLDQSMYRLFERVISPTLTEVQKKQTKVYFPIAKNRESFKRTLDRAQMSNLETFAPEIYNFLESIQPYSSENCKWLNDFADFANDKHIRLTPQEIIEQNETDLAGVRVRRGEKVMMRGVYINGIPVNSEDINQTPLENFDPRLKVKRRTLIYFNFEGTDVNMLGLCTKAVSDLDETIQEFFKLINKSNLLTIKK